MLSHKFFNIFVEIFSNDLKEALDEKALKGKAEKAHQVTSHSDIFHPIGALNAIISLVQFSIIFEDNVSRFLHLTLSLNKFNRNMNEAELNEESLPHKMLQVQSYLARNFFYDLTLLNSVFLFPPAKLKILEHKMSFCFFCASCLHRRALFYDSNLIFRSDICMLGGFTYVHACAEGFFTFGFNIFFIFIPSTFTFKSTSIPLNHNSSYSNENRVLN